MRSLVATRRSTNLTDQCATPTGHHSPITKPTTQFHTTRGVPRKRPRRSGGSEPLLPYSDGRFLNPAGSDQHQTPDGEGACLTRLATGSIRSVSRRFLRGFGRGEVTWCLVVTVARWRCWRGWVETWRVRWGIAGARRGLETSSEEWVSRGISMR